MHGGISQGMSQRLRNSVSDSCLLPANNTHTTLAPVREKKLSSLR